MIMRIKGKIHPSEDYREVKSWPHCLVGTLDIVDCGDPIDELGAPSWCAARFFIDGGFEKEVTGFGFRGDVFSTSEVTFDEIDSGLKVQVYLVPDDGKYVATPKNRKLFKEQLYKAVKFERI